MSDNGAMDFVVRDSTIEDFDEVFALTEVVAASGKWIGTEVPIDYDQRRAGFVRHLEGDRLASFVATSDGRIVGNLGIHVEAHGVAEFGMLVAEDARGHGVGSALLVAAIDFARATDAHKVVLQMWPHNHPARALYQKHGFVQEAYLRREYRRRNGELWDAVRLGLVLDESSPASPYLGD
jgi:RimJ/RimL family protein N-acetyltransferase